MTNTPTEGLDEAEGLLRDGDPVGAVRCLRGVVDDVPIADSARVVAGAATALGLTTLAERADAAAHSPTSASRLFEFGYECIEEGGLCFVAVPVLAEALRQRPRHRNTLLELAVALEHEDRYAEVVDLLERRFTAPWPEVYMLASNALLAGDIERAAHHTMRLPVPPDKTWARPYDWLHGAIGRLERLRDHSPLDGRDLRGWHYVLNDGVLGTLAAGGYDAGMNGRYAWLQDSAQLCRHGLHRLQVALSATGCRPAAVGLLPDRSSTILGLAAARVLGLPAHPYQPGTPDTVVVAYNLADAEEETLSSLVLRAPGELLVEYATCWTSPPPVSADFAVLLGQSVRPAWDGRLVLSHEAGTRREPVDDRPAEVVAAEIAAAEPTAVEADGDGPPDGDDVLTGLVGGLATAWPARDGIRHRPRSPGPVRSSSFR